MSLKDRVSKNVYRLIPDKSKETEQKKIEEHHYLFKMLIIGNSTVGKSKFMIYNTESNYSDSYNQTIGVEFSTMIRKYENKYRIKGQIWDTAGQESFRAITRIFYRGAHACLVLYDVTNRGSFEDVNTWLEEVKAHSEPGLLIVLVGAKNDLYDKREVSFEEGLLFARSKGLSFFEASAKTGANV